MTKQGHVITTWLMICMVAAFVVACGGGGGGGTAANSPSTALPAVPTAVAAKCGNQTVTVSWTGVAGAASYNIYRSATAGVAGTLLGNSTTASYIDATGTLGTAYYYTVTAVNSAGESTRSAAVADTFYKLMGGALQGASLTLANNVSTFAGTAGFSGLTDGIGTAAKLSMPQGMANDGNYLYVADYLNNAIRRIDPVTQAVTLFAGSPTGASGYADGAGSAALFFRPYDVTSDGTNLYVTEFNGCMIRKIVIATATVSTLAGQSQVCGTSVNGTGTAATFTKPKGITTDGTSLFVTESTDVRQINIATGVVTTIAGGTVVGHVDTIGTAARFNNLEGITTDGTSLFVVDSYYQDIRKIDIATKTVSSLAGNYLVVNSTTSLDGAGTGARFTAPRGITTDGTNLYVMESGSGVTGGGDDVRKIVISTAAVTTLAGNPGVPGIANGIGSAAQFSNPWGITINCGRLFIGDNGNSTIRVLQ